jgi:hypothetical protein
MPKEYEKKGIKIAKEIVFRRYSRQDIEMNKIAPGQYILMHGSTGTALTPICPGENSAWRSAAMLIVVSNIVASEFGVEEGLLDNSYVEVV